MIRKCSVPRGVPFFLPKETNNLFLFNTSTGAASQHEASPLSTAVIVPCGAFQ